MSELKHWLDDSSDSDEFERSILRAGLDADPPLAKRDEIWTGLMATVAVVPLAAVATSAQLASAKVATAGVSKAAAVWLAVAKGFVVGLAVYGAAQGVTEISSRFSAPHTPAPSAQPAQRAKAPARAPSREGEPSSAASAPSLIPTSKEAPSTPRAAEAGSSARAREPLNAIIPLPSIATFDNREPPAPVRVSQLEAETRALRRARDELRTGKLADAFATLEASQRQFSAPELYQEREALMIELLHRSGQVTAAERRASAFLSRFPESPHVQQIRRFAAK